MRRSGAHLNAGPFRLSQKQLELERVPQAEYDPAVSAISSPLIQEVRRIDSRLGNAEVPGVRRIVHLSPKLDLMSLGQGRVLKDPNIHICDAVCPQRIASEIADTLRRRDLAEQAGPARLVDLLNRHPRNILGRVEIRPDCIAHQTVDPGQCAAGIGAIEDCERRSALQRDE